MRSRRPFATLLELVSRVGPHRLEQAVPGVSGTALDVHERLVGQRPHEVGHIVVLDSAVAHRGRRGSQVEAAREDGEAREGGLLGFAQQLVVPVEQPLHRPLSSGGARIAAAEELEAVPQPFEDLGWRQHGEASRGELDREGHAVEMAADLGEHSLVFGSRAKSGRCARARSTKSCSDVVVRRQRADPPELFARKGERLATRREDRDRGHPVWISLASRAEASGTCSQLSRISKRRPRHEVVEHHRAIVSLASGHAECIRHRGRDDATVGRLREVGDPHAIRPGGGDPEPELDGEAGSSPCRPGRRS